MNQRDYHYVEDRCYGNTQLADAMVRLRSLGEDDLADVLHGIVTRESDALRGFRAELRELMNKEAV